MDRAFWDQVIATRLAIGPALETARKAGQIGSSLDAELDLYAAPEHLERLARLGDELRFALIVSEVRLHPLNERPDDAVDDRARRAGRADLGLRVTPNACAAGTIAPTSDPIPSIRNSAGVASRTSLELAKHVALPSKT